LDTYYDYWRALGIISKDVWSCLDGLKVREEWIVFVQPEMRIVRTVLDPVEYYGRCLVCIIWKLIVLAWKSIVLVEV